jgi:hypothetical protein
MKADGSREFLTSQQNAPPKKYRGLLGLFTLLEYPIMQYNVATMKTTF